MAFWMYAVVALGWFTGGIVGGATGMGSVMVSMPILMPVFPAGDAVVISCLCALYGNIHLIMVYHKLASSKDVRELIIGCLPGCLLGTLVLKIAPVQVLELMVCAMLVCFIIMRYRSGASAYRHRSRYSQRFCPFFGSPFWSSTGNLRATQTVGARQSTWQFQHILFSSQSGNRGVTGVCRTLPYRTVSLGINGHHGLCRRTICRSPHRSAY